MNRGGLRRPCGRKEFRESEDAHDHGYEADAVQEPVHAEGEARGTGNGVDADHGDQQAQGAGDDRFDHGLAGQGDEQRNTDDHQGEEFRRSDEQAQFPEGLGGSDQPMVAIVPPTKDPTAAMVSAAPALPILVMA